ncbi:hypothetical protein ACO229_20000 [Promicromonospora sp. MS192]|uniref:hypothetical protein n=1 Tax=Promicromonospora sp. MS192 TaxID=3412684 RepID=UPI003C2CB2A5
MSATRRKGSRGGRAASRAGGPPASNALTWAESLASGDPAPGASALEWAEGLAAKEPAPSPWGSASVTATEAPATGDDGGSPWGPVPAPAVADPEGESDANPWGPVAVTEPPVARGRGKSSGGKGGKARGRSKGKGARSGAKGAPKSDADAAPTPAGGFPLNVGPVADVDDVPPPAPAEDVDPASPDVLPDPADAPAGRTTPKPGAGTTRPRGRLDTAQQKRIKRTLRRGLPPFLDRPTVLVSAGVVAALLGLGTGWVTSLSSGGGPLSAADAASCAQTQMAWTQAANAQSAMVEDQPETLRKGFINARNALEGVTPPEAIAEDWAVAFTYYSTVANNIEKVKADDGPAVTSAVGGAQEELDTQAMVAASQRVQEYVASNCQG